MKIHQFLYANQMTMREMAKIIGCCAGTISNYANRIQRPTTAMAKLIEICTGGKVTSYELLDGEYKSDLNLKNNKYKKKVDKKP